MTLPLSGNALSGGARRPNEMILSEGVHWEHFPAQEGDLLAIIYAPVNLPSPNLPHYKRTSKLRCGRLLINPGTNNFYQDCVSGVSDLIARVSEGYARTLHFGFSAGAYAALRFGAVDPKGAGIYAIAPHFVLDRPMTRSFVLSKMMSDDRRDVDIIDLINQSKVEDIRVMLSCLDSMDGVQVRDSLRIQNKRIQLVYRMLEHKLLEEDMPDLMIGHYLENGCFPQHTSVPLATNDQIDDAMATYDLMLAVTNNMRVDDLIVARNPMNHVFMYCKGRYLENTNDLVGALPSYAAAVALAKNSRSGSLFEMLIVMGNAYLRAGFADIAIGCYRSARRIAVKNPTSYLREADALVVGRRFEELSQLATDYESNIGADETLSIIIARAKTK